MAVSADKKTEWMEGRDIVYKGNIGAKIYAGALVAARNISGDLFLSPAVDQPGLRVIGIALESKDVGNNQALLVRTTGAVKLKVDVSPSYPPGSDVYVVDDETVTDDTSFTTNSIVAGKLVKSDDDPNYAWVRIG